MIDCALIASLSDRLSSQKSNSRQPIYGACAFTLVEAIRLSEERIPLRECGELVSAEIATRGLILGLVAKSLNEKYGRDAVEIIEKASYEAGRTAGRNAARSLPSNDLSSIAELFGRSAATRHFNPEIVEHTKDRVVIHWRSCPIPSLLADFKQKGLGDDYLGFLCPIVEHLDNGFVEGFNPGLTAMTPPQTGEMGLTGNGGFCTIIISKKK